MGKARNIKKEEFKEMMELVNSIFKPGMPGRMELEYPHLYNGRRLWRHFIIKEDSKIASHVSLHPIDLSVNNSIIKIAGIGGVATLEEYRGKGLMSETLKTVIPEMKKRNFDISILLGERKIYGSFGWENAGRKYEFTMNKRSVSCFGNIKTRIRKYEEKSDLNKIIRVHEKESFKAKRSIKDYASMFKNPACEVFVAVQDNLVLSYIVLKGDAKEKRICEFGGNSLAFQHLITYVFESLCAEKLVVYSPFIFNCLNDVLFKGSSYWNITSIGMVKIVNLKSTLEKFGPQMQARLNKIKNKMKSKITLEILETGDSATLDIRNDIKISGQETSKKIILNQNNMVRLLFGITSPSKQFDLGEVTQVMDQIFPLDFYIWEPDFV